MAEKEEEEEEETNRKQADRIMEATNSGNHLLALSINLTPFLDTYALVYIML